MDSTQDNDRKLFLVKIVHFDIFLPNWLARNNKIIACLNAIRDRGGDIRFANLHDASEQYFHLTKLETVVQVFGAVETAIASFGE